MTEATLEAVRREVTVQAPRERAFAVFTERFDSWWPRTHKIGAADMAEAIVEPRAGGRWYERDADGSECDWGEVLAWEPPHRLVLSWHLASDWSYDPDPAHASEIEVTFTPEGDATRVQLVHHRFERHAAGGEEMRGAVGNDAGGWGGLLTLYSEAVESS